MQSPSIPKTSFVANSKLRSRLLELLSKGPKTPTELASLEKKHVSHVSRALMELRAQGLVESTSTQSRERYYRTTIQGMAIYYQLARIPK
jgi:DNA-binding transcriptional ArsR family regulator